MFKLTHRNSVFRTWLAISLLAIQFFSSSVVVLSQSSAIAPAPSLSTAESELAARINVETIREVVSALSADEMEGRGTAQPGGDKAANYLAARFEKLGLKPLGAKNSFLQPIKFRELQFLPETTMKIGNDTLQLGTDFVVTPPYSGNKNVKGNLMFVAYGLTSRVPKRDDLAGIDVRGKIVVMMQGPPAVVDKGSWKKANIQTDIIRSLIGLGAVGLIQIDHGREEHSYSKLADYMVRRQIEPADEVELPPFLPPFVQMSDEAADRMFKAAGLSRAQALANAENEGFKPIDLKQSATINVRFKKSTGIGNNVIGLLEGSDPKLSSEALVYSAHYDAFGVSADKRIYHGAADNALGVGQMIAIAEALVQTTPKPKRSIIFMAVTGEEYGGHGSDHWVNHPTWKIKQVAANLNLDGMGTDVYGPVKVIVGFGAEHSSLGPLLTDVAAATGVTVIPDPRPEEKAFYRSDHYYFVKKGIPGIMLLGAPAGETKTWIERLKQWEKSDYHQPSDVIRPDWNWDGPRTIAVIHAVLGLRVATQDLMPKWVNTSPFNRERGTNAAPPPEP